MILQREKKTAFFLKRFVYRMHLMHFHCELCGKLSTKHWLVKWPHMSTINAFSQNEHFIVLYVYCVDFFLLTLIVLLHQKWCMPVESMDHINMLLGRSMRRMIFSPATISAFSPFSYVLKIFDGFEDPKTHKALHPNCD